MNLVTINRLVFGLIATVVGVAFWLMAPPKQTTHAGGVTTYTSTWDSVDNLVARRYWTNWTPGSFSDIVFGVATWKVTGYFTNPTGDNGPYFKEIWDSPSMPPTFRSNGTIANMGDGWLAGAILNTTWDIAKIEIIKLNKSAPLIGSNQKGGATLVSGPTATCRDVYNDECIYATGAYGFTDYHNFVSSNSGKDNTVAVVIPTRWTVSGTVCELQTAPECH